MDNVDKKIKNYLDKYYMKDRGRYLNKERWYSICSAHQKYNKECKTCNIGSWNNIFLGKLSSILFKLFPKIWRFMMKNKKTKLCQNS